MNNGYEVQKKECQPRLQGYAEDHWLYKTGDQGVRFGLKGVVMVLKLFDVY